MSPSASQPAGGISLQVCAKLALWLGAGPAHTHAADALWMGQGDFRRLYRAYGFEIIEGRLHTVVRHPEYPDLNTPVARHQELAPAYARTAVRLIEELRRRMAERSSKE
jgi:hypothetical protein